MENYCITCTTLHLLLWSNVVPMLLRRCIVVSILRSMTKNCIVNVSRHHPTQLLPITKADMNTKYYNSIQTVVAVY